MKSGALSLDQIQTQNHFTRRVVSEAGVYDLADETVTVNLLLKNGTEKGSGCSPSQGEIKTLDVEPPLECLCARARVPVQ